MKRLTHLAILSALFSTSVNADQVILDDLIVNGSACIGLDCVDGEIFGFDTLRLKENNLRIQFVDTSSSGSFASNDWQITVNESENGGLNKFSIDDITGSKTPFTVEAGAASHSLYVDDSGRIGLGTNTPSVQLHQKHGNTPTVRLEQDGSSGFTSQTWDMAGNETNFFVRDVSNGSTLPFRIKPGALTDTLYLSTDRNVGIGTTSPQSNLHIKTSDKPAIRLEDTGSGETWLITNNFNTLRFSIPGSGMVEAEIDEEGNFTPAGKVTLPGTTYDWSIRNNFDQLRFSIPGSGIVEATLDASGNLTIGGTLTTGSSRSFKTNILPVDAGDIMDKIKGLPIATWSYLKDKHISHIGPMAEDFYALFGFGSDEKHIAPADMAAIALIAAKELTVQNDELSSELKRKDEQLYALTQQFELLNRRITNLENKTKNNDSNNGH